MWDDDSYPTGSTMKSWRSTTLPYLAWMLLHADVSRRNLIKRTMDKVEFSASPQFSLRRLRMKCIPSNANLAGFHVVNIGCSSIASGEVIIVEVSHFEAKICLRR